jgi:hypothetical protein
MVRMLKELHAGASAIRGRWECDSYSRMKLLCGTIQISKEDHGITLLGVLPSYVHRAHCWEVVEIEYV